MEKKLYFTQLDSLRFWAFLLVFWQHIRQYIDKDLIFFNNSSVESFFNQLPSTGGIGVDIFFVISGFLITFLLIREEELNGKVNLFYFYVRRILRIWPLYYLVILLGIFVLPRISDQFFFDGKYALNLLFLNNFDVWGQGPNIAIAWSVAIEEQFYLFWPVMFLIFRNKNILMAVSVILFFLSIGFIILYPSIEKYHTFGNLNYLMIGCMGGILFSRNEEIIRKSKVFKPIGFFYAIIISFLLIIALAYSPFIRFGSLLYLTALIGLPLAYLYMIINLVIRARKKRIGFISRLGKYTYGMYLYHPMIVIFAKIALDQLNLDYRSNSYLNFILVVISLIVTIVISYLSYEYLEKYILNFKNRFSFVKTRT